MKQIIKTLKPAVVCFAVMTLLCGLIYTALITGIAQAAFPGQANGSIITAKSSDGAVKEYGSELIGQEFTKPEYLIGRPIGITNLSAVSKEEEELVEARIDQWHKLDSANKALIPMDLVTASGSGCDPNITPEAAEYQVARIAEIRGMSIEEVEAIIEKCTAGRFLGFWGEPHVNVLKVNLMLDGLPIVNR
jgi:K+-transporting ATPase ATPase C chain